MVLLAAEDIKTRDVLGWRGVHLLHFAGSSCSQKVRIVLNLKGVAWQSHPVDIAIRKENTRPWFLGINPRGLVPVLVHDGAVHIESNDILHYVDETFDGPRLIPAGKEEQARALLDAENAMHFDLRNLTLRYTAPRGAATKSARQQRRYRDEGSGTVGGTIDMNKQQELDYWDNFAKHGISDEMVRVSVGTFRRAFTEFETRLIHQPYLLGADLSVVDIAWFIYATRVTNTGYPLAELHPRVHGWHAALMQRPEFAREVVAPLPLRLVAAMVQLRARIQGKTLRQVAAL